MSSDTYLELQSYASRMSHSEPLFDKFRLLKTLAKSFEDIGDFKRRKVSYKDILKWFSCDKRDILKKRRNAEYIAVQICAEAQFKFSTYMLYVYAYCITMSSCIYMGLNVKLN